MTLRNVVNSQAQKISTKKILPSNLPGTMRRHCAVFPSNVETMPAYFLANTTSPLHVSLQVNCIRVPVVEEGAPAESCFDIMLESLKDEPASTQCVFSCQMGRGRTTLGMVVACLIKEIQVGLNGSIADRRSVRK